MANGHVTVESISCGEIHISGTKFRSPCRYAGLKIFQVREVWLTLEIRFHNQVWLI